ncbi:MAG: DNA polymerase [Alphaproteobacteria bacterium]|nr:DNA polymerase [Alphaproteobacteria bacterium]
MRLHFDIECNGLLDTVSKVHCIAAMDVDTHEQFEWGPKEIPQALETLSKADKLVAHFGLGFDFPALEKVHGFVVPPEKQVDSYIIAKLIKPGQKDHDHELVQAGRLPSKLHGKHSIEAWGYRLGIQKLHADIEVWDFWTKQMQERCVGDVATQAALWDDLKPDKYSQRAIELEHRIARLCRRMERAGCWFDAEAAQRLHVELLGKQEGISQALIEEFGFWYEPVKKGLDKAGYAQTWTPKRPDAKAGYWGDYEPEMVKDPFTGEKVPTGKKTFVGYAATKIERVDFNPSSRRHIIRKLKELGWQPTAFTEAGEAKVDDDVLESLAEDFPQAAKLAEYLLLEKRLGQIADGDNAWLKKVGDDGKMHGAIDTLGTVHSRASHFSPNMGQVPASKSPYGAECRALFGPNGLTTLQAGWGGPDEPIVQVGADMSGLQLRALAHLLHPLDDGAYSQIVTSGDVHWAHAQAMGLVEPDEPRDKHSELHNILREKGAKTFGYSYLFGCFPPKSGRVVRDCLTTAKAKNPEWGYLFDRFFKKKNGKVRTDSDVGKQVRKSFDEKLKLEGLHAKLKKCLATYKNHLPGLDGRLVPCRSDHSALNFACSSIEAILCKQWLCDSVDALESKGYVWGKDFVTMLWVHDEQQIACRSSIAEEVGKTLVECAKQAGEKLGFRVPLASEYKIGLNWLDCH